LSQLEDSADLLTIKSSTICHKINS